jgi:hypothetical protein
MSEKSVVNTLYHGAMVSGLTLGYAQLGRLLLSTAPPQLKPSGRDVGMLVLDVTAALATRDWLVAQGILPADILK